MVADAEVICQQTLAVQYVCVPSPTANDFYDVGSATPIGSPVFRSPESDISLDLARSGSALSCSTSICSSTIFESPKIRQHPNIRSGSHTDIGPRSSNEDQHVCIDDLTAHLGKLCRWSQPSSFYAVFDGHGGSDAAAYLKDNAVRFLFGDAELPQTSEIDHQFLQDLETCHSRSFLLVDKALADENSSVDSYCGTTALTALVLGKHLLVANAGDCRAVLCRKGDAIQLTQDHRPSCPEERKRVEDLGGTIEYGYLNGELAVTRALGDWYMKLPLGSASPLTAQPEFQQTLLDDDDEFLILGCDGIWDVLTNQDAVNLVRRELRRHNDPQQCAKELISLALRKDTCDNLTAIVVCFTCPDSRDTSVSRRPKLQFCMSEEARNKLRSYLEGN